MPWRKGNRSARWELRETRPPLTSTSSCAWGTRRSTRNDTCSAEGRAMNRLKRRIRNIPDFPIKGIQFKDITTLLADPASYQRAIDLLAHRDFDKGIEAVVGIEARGFVMGAALAYKLGVGVILVRKAGKLPYRTGSAGDARDAGENR